MQEFGVIEILSRFASNICLPKALSTCPCFFYPEFLRWATAVA